MSTPSRMYYTLGDSAFGYVVVSNHDFFIKDYLCSEKYNNAMPYHLLPVLKEAMNKNSSKESFLDMNDAISYLDKKNANTLAFMYYKAKISLSKIQRNPLYLFGISRNYKEDKKALKNIIRNVNKLGNSEDILFFVIKKNIPVENKIIFPDIYIYPEIEENPWFLDIKNEDRGVFVYETAPKLETLFLHSIKNGEKRETHYYPKYKFFLGDDRYGEVEFILHRENGKIKIKGVLDSYSTTRILYKNKESLIDALDKEKEMWLDKVNDIESTKEILKTSESH